MRENIQLKDVLHFYFGCEGMLSFSDEPDSFLSKLDANVLKRLFDDPDETSFEPMLRPLSSMTKEEMEECGNMVYDFSDDPTLNKWKPSDFEIGLAPEHFLWLVKKGFDIFGLIESNQAIDKSKPLPHVNR